MKRDVHMRRPPAPPGKKRDDREGTPLCGARSSKVDTRDRVTCERCIRILTKRTWQTR